MTVNDRSNVLVLSAYKQRIQRREKTHSNNIDQESAVRLIAEGKRRHDLILEHRITARKIGRSILNNWGCRLDTDEVNSAVDLALCEAAKGFNAGHGASFSTYLFYFLKGKLAKSLKAAASKEIPCESSRDEASAEGMSSIESLYEEALQRNPDLPRVPTPEEIIAHRQLSAKCRKVVGSLNEVERSVVFQSGMAGEKMNGLARNLGYSRGHLFAIRKAAFDTIRDGLEDFRQAA